MKHICLVGFAYAGGQTKKGAKYAFDALMKDRTTLEICKMYNVRMVRIDPQVHLPQVSNPITTEMKYRNYEFASQILHSTVLHLLQEQYYTVCVGGDHSMAVGSISAAKAYAPELHVCWTDAHSDCNTEETSPSGNIHGMPVAILAGLNKQSGSRFKCLDLNSDLQYIGVRDCDPCETILIDRYKIPVYPHLDTERHQQNFKSRTTTRPQWLSLDVDALDPSIIKATGTPSPGGLTHEQLDSILETVLPTSIGMDIAEFNFEVCSQSERNSQISIFRDILCSVIRHKTDPILRRTDYHNSDNESE